MASAPNQTKVRLRKREISSLPENGPYCFNGQRAIGNDLRAQDLVELFHECYVRSLLLLFLMLPFTSKSSCIVDEVHFITCCWYNSNVLF